MTRKSFAAMAITALVAVVMFSAGQAHATPAPTCTFVEHEGDQQTGRFAEAIHSLRLASDTSPT